MATHHVVESVWQYFICRGECVATHQVVASVWQLTRWRRACGNSLGGSKSVATHQMVERGNIAMNEMVSVCHSDADIG